MSAGASGIRAGYCLLLALLLAGCNDFSGPIVCTTEAVPAIELTAQNAESGDPVADALAVAAEGTFADSMQTRMFGGEALAHLALERSGTYEVSVEKDGFLTWEESGVEVDEGVCHVETVSLAARLVPSSN